MRIGGTEYEGDGITIAIIDSGVRSGDPRLHKADINGWQIQLSATNHAVLSDDFEDVNGHGTELAVVLHKYAPKAKLLAIRIMNQNLTASADLLVAGIETAYKVSGADIIMISFGTPNMGKAMILRDACAMANESGSLIVAAAHPQGSRSYPADVPEVIGVTSHPNCLLRNYFMDPLIYKRKDWKSLSGKFLFNGYFGDDYRGAGYATARFVAEMACIKEANPDLTPIEYRIWAQNRAFLPIPELGYK